MTSTPADRLAINGRFADPTFEPTELLYIRFEKHENDRVLHSQLGYPGTDGMSLNRGRYSEPEDVLWPNWATLGVAEVAVARLPSTELSGSDEEFGLEPRHTPWTEPPENYAHTSYVTYRARDSAKLPLPKKKVPNRVKTQVRAALSERLTIHKWPGPPAAWGTSAS